LDDRQERTVAVLLLDEGSGGALLRFHKRSTPWSPA
jgi:hypothetical protein